MEEVTRYPWGTAKKAFAGASYQSAGKTGTVQLRKLNEDRVYDASKIDKKYHDNAIYVGYAPIKQPEVAIVVVAENGGHGGESAAPVARKVFDAYFNGSTKP
ncbi:MAG: penicillin-binding transpeptidase domain-containing protein [Enterobacterales bacterium]|nr:penicillin-binding transpeptidase domain-containing protein [Enterobacterales bacterium]